MSYYDENEKIWYCKNGLPATTLYLQSMSDESRVDHVFDHFSAFGAVTNVSIHGTPTNWFGYVTFGDATSAARASVMKFHTIDRQQTRVTIADVDATSRGLQFANELNDCTATKLTNLNDDCLYEVFSLVSRAELMTVARTCTRFKAIANRVFSNVHKTLNLDNLTVTKYHDALRVLATSGMLLSEIQVSIKSYIRRRGHEDVDYERLLDSVATRCANTLESLIFVCCDIDIPKWLAIKFRPLLNKLKKLHIIGSTFKSDDNEIFADCESLVDLKVRWWSLGESEKNLLKKTYLKLERLDLGFSVLENLESEFLENFISRHKNVKSLSVWNCLASTLSIIGDNCKGLDELQLTFVHNIIENGEGFKKLSTLMNLRNLKINFYGQNLTLFLKHLKDLKSLECLELERIETDPRLIPHLSQWKKLKVLRFINCRIVSLNGLGHLNQLTELIIIDDYIMFKTSELVALIKRLVNLKFLHLNYYDTLRETFLYIVDIVRERRRPDKQILRVKCNVIDDFSDVQFHGDNHEIVKLIPIIKG